jgi:hypothetical protein
MKKLIIFAVLVVFGNATGSAQDIVFGAKAGLNLATLQPDLTDPATRISFHFGGMVEIPIMDAFSVQPELLYSGQGVKDKSDDDEVVRLNYLTLPVLAKYYVANNLSIEAGPQFGFLLSAEREDDGETTDIKDISKSTDIGFALGLGYELESGLNFGLRYYFGSDINEIEEDPNKISNRAFQISLGYFFN